MSECLSSPSVVRALRAQSGNYILKPPVLIKPILTRSEDWNITFSCSQALLLFSSVTKLLDNCNKYVCGGWLAFCVLFFFFFFFTLIINFLIAAVAALGRGDRAVAAHHPGTAEVVVASPCWKPWQQPTQVLLSASLLNTPLETLCIISLQ